MLTHRDFRLATLLALAVGVFLIPPLVHIHERAIHIGITLGTAVVIGAILICNIVIFITRTLDKRVPILFTFTKFFITGVFNTSFDISIVNLFTYIFALYAGLPIVIFSIISYIITLFMSYAINRSWSFGAAHNPSIKEFLLFTGASSFSFIINTTLLYVLTTVTGAPNGVAEALWVNIVKLATAVISMVLNFITFKFLVFKKRDVLTISEPTPSPQQTGDSVPTEWQNR